MKLYGVTIEADGQVVYEKGGPAPWDMEDYSVGCSGTVNLDVWAETEDRAKGLALDEAYDRFEFYVKKKDMRCTYCEEIDEGEHAEEAIVVEYFDDTEKQIMNAMD